MDMRNITRPCFPILAVTYPFNQLGIDGISEFLAQIQPELEAVFYLLTVLVIPRIAANDLNEIGLGGVEIKFADHIGQAVIMRTQGAQNFPDHGIGFIVIQSLFGRFAKGYNNRQNHIAVILAFGLAHDTAYGLHHIDL